MAQQPQYSQEEIPQDQIQDLSQQDQLQQDELQQLTEQEYARAANESYLDAEDYYENADRNEDSADEQDRMEWADIPKQKKEDSVYTLFNKVWKSRDSSKVANLDKAELGKAPVMTVRDAKMLALVGYTFHHPKFGFFFNQIAEITLATSASKKGWFTELFVTQRKTTARFTGFQDIGENPTTVQPKKQFGLFGSKSLPEGG